MADGHWGDSVSFSDLGQEPDHAFLRDRIEPVELQIPGPGGVLHIGDLGWIVVQEDDELGLERHNFVCCPPRGLVATEGAIVLEKTLHCLPDGIGQSEAPVLSKSRTLSQAGASARTLSMSTIVSFFRCILSATGRISVANQNRTWRSIQRYP